jgi:plasminogen activator inhibitor 1 RNA-binding protein
VALHVSVLHLSECRCSFVVAVREARNYGAPPRDGPGRGVPGRGRGGRGGRFAPRRDYGDADATGFEGGYGYGGGFGDAGVARGENVEGRQAERGRGPRHPYRGGGRRGGYADAQGGDESGHPRRAYERHSGTGRGYEMKREGAGRGNWGTATDEGLAQLRCFIGFVSCDLFQSYDGHYKFFDHFCVSLTRDIADAVNTEEIAAVVEGEKKPEDTPQSEVEKGKEGTENEEEEPEPEDKVCF